MVVNLGAAEAENGAAKTLACAGRSLKTGYNACYNFAPEPEAVRRRTTVEDSQRREIEQLDQLTRKVSESHHEETRQQIDELYQRLKNLGDDAAGQGPK